jgi:hypothetical protein
MSDVEFEDDQLRQRKQYAGGYVAWLDGQVILSAETDDELCDQLDQMPIDPSRVVIGYIPPADVVYIPSFRVIGFPSTPR